MNPHLDTGIDRKISETAQNLRKQLRDKTAEIIFLSTKLNHAKETCVNLDLERQRFREVRRKIKEKDIDPVWIYNGTCFLQTSQANGLNILEQDTIAVDEVLEQVKNVIKQDTDTFLKLNQQRNLQQRGFDLKPLVKDGKLTD